MGRRFDYLDDVEAFIAVADHGSFTAGAVALSTTASVLSRAVARLEVRLGSQLLRRTTRRLSLTEAGRQYLEQVHAAFALLGDAERDVQGAGSQLTGQVRISAPTSYGHYRLPPLLAHFAELHPQVQVEVNIANRNVDLVAEGFDLAIRMGQFPDSGLVVRKLEDAALCLVASPAYIARRGTPSSLAELQTHDCLSFVMPSTGRIATWSLQDEGRDVEWMPPGRFQISDDVLGTASLATAGMGIAQTYDFIAAERIRTGALVDVLPRLRGCTRPFSVVYAPHRRLSAATRSLIDVLTHVSRAGLAARS